MRCRQPQHVPDVLYQQEITHYNLYNVLYYACAVLKADRLGVLEVMGFDVKLMSQIILLDWSVSWESLRFCSWVRVSLLTIPLTIFHQSFVVFFVVLFFFNNSSQKLLTLQQLFPKAVAQFLNCSALFCGSPMKTVRSEKLSEWNLPCWVLLKSLFGDGVLQGSVCMI